MSGNRSRFWKQAKIDWNFILSIKFVKRAKSTLFTFKFKLAIQKKIFRSKSTIELFNLRQNAKVTVPITQLPFRQNLKFSNFSLCKKNNKIQFYFYFKNSKNQTKSKQKFDAKQQIANHLKIPKKNNRQCCQSTSTYPAYVNRQPCLLQFWFWPKTVMKTLSNRKKQNDKQNQKREKPNKN